MSQEINELLVSLHSFLQNVGSTHTGEKACSLAADLSSVCLSQASESKIAYYSSVLFNEEKGILCFLNKAIRHDEFLECKVELLEFLLKFLEKISSRIEPYAIAIKDVCFAITCRDAKSKPKVKAFELLINLLEIVGKTTVRPELKADAMIKRFFSDLMQPISKLPQSVRHKLYEILGVFAAFYPELMVNYSEKLLKIYLRALKEQMTSTTKKPELTAISGCLTGLTHFLTSFTQSCEEESEHSDEIYRYAKMSIDPTVDLQRYHIPKAGLLLFTKHAPQFNEYLYRDHVEIYDKIFKWTKHGNRDMRKAGYKSLDSFLKVLADMLVEKANSGDGKGRAVFKWFIQKFKSIIDDPTSDSMDLATGVRGYGFFAAPCKLLLSKEDVQFMFSEMIQRSEQLYLQQEQVSDENVSHLPNFLEALASIIQQLDQLSDSFILPLEHLFAVMINSFPQVPFYQQFLCSKALLNVLITLAPKGSTLKDFLSVIVYQGLIKTISHRVHLGVNLDQENRQSTAEDAEDIQSDARTITFRNYIQLWLQLLDSPLMKEVDALGTNYQDRCQIHVMVYEELLLAVLKVLHKLDLTSTKKQTSEDELLDVMAQMLDISSDPIHGLQPTNAKDFQIFINLVEFFRELLPQTKPEYFEPWVLKFSQEVIVMSTQNPLISGFYKLLSVSMTGAKKISYFEDCSEGDEDSMDVAYTHMECVSQNERQVSFTLFTKFTLEVLVRLKLFKDDLLVACLQYILSLPHEIVEDILEKLIPAMKITFQLGLSYLRIAEAGLSALTTWTSNIPQDKLKPMYNEVLPLFDDYLRATSLKENETGVTVQVSRTAGRRAPTKASFTKPKEISGLADESPLKKVQLSILKFLGSLGGQMNACMLNSNSEEIAKVAVAWDREPRLPYPVPFFDIKPTINLDLFLPRIVELAVSSGNRQTKVAACESLHTIVLYMLGLGNQQTDQRQAKSPMQNLYKRVFPALLRLACDVEEVAKQLFEPFVMQLIHWFTNNRKFESEETMSLLGAILDGIIHPTNTALRDFSAKCVKEFLKWSIKQTTKSQQEKSPINTKSLLKRLYSMALHPNTFKRLGAALAFNNIYTVFREEDSLVDMFTFEMLVVYVRSLALAHHDDKSLGTQEQGSEVLKHLGRIVKEKAALFNKTSKLRRLPRGFPQDMSPTLSHMILFLLTECGRPQTECRHQCMNLVSQLTPLQPGGCRTSDWMKNTLKEKGPDYFCSRFEGGGGTGSAAVGIRKYLTLPSMSSAFSLKISTRWFDNILAALDCYCWSFGERLVTPSDVFTSRSNTALFESMEFFLQKLAMSDINAATRLFRTKASDTFTPREHEEYNYAKCTVTVRVFDFLMILLKTCPNDIQKVLPARILDEHLIGLIVSCVLEPCSVGFNMADIMVISNLPKTTSTLLNELMNRVPPLRGKIKKFIIEKLDGNRNLNIFHQLDSLFTDTNMDFTKVLHLISGFKQLHQAGLLVPAISKEGVPSQMDLANQLLNCVFNSLFITQEGCLVTRKPSPMSLDLGQQLLKLAFSIGIQTKLLLSYLRNKDRVVSSLNTSKNSSVRKGAVFFTTFKSTIIHQFLKQVNEATMMLMQDLEDDPQQTCNIMGNILQTIINDKQLRKKYGTGVVNAVLSNWNKLRPWWIEGSSQDMKASCLLLLKSLLQIDSKFASDCQHPSFKIIFKMYTGFLLDRKSPLTFKAQVLEVLYFFTQVTEPQLTELKECLDEFVTYNFPLTSTEFKVGTSQYNDYITAFNKLLTALVFSGSMILLEVIISVVCREAKHVHENSIQDTFAAFIKRLQPDEQQKACNVSFEIFLKESSFPKEMRRATIERVCIPMLRLSSAVAVKAFFKSHIKKMMSIIEAKQTKYPEATFEVQLVSKICSFQLVEIMYSRLTKEELRSPGSEINRAFCELADNKGDELTKAISKVGRTVMVEDVRGETVAMELRRQLHCMAYNTMMAVICCTQTELKFYNVFLFSDNTAKGQFLLENIIDARRQYTFEIEFDAQPERKKRYIAIRNQARQAANNGQEGAEESIHYLSSQYLADSSLSEDIHRFDFTGSRQFTPSVDSMSQADDAKNSSNQEAVSENQPSAMVYGDSVVMEDDALNQHECMASLVGLLNHMKANITPQQATQGSQSSSMPAWMAWLHQKAMKSSDLGTKLFIARLIVNIPEIFQPYAQHWFAPLISIIVGGSSAGEGIHSMVVDIMVVMLQWTPVAIPQERVIANRLVEFLMNHSYHPTKQVLRRNLDLIKTTIECWKSVLNISTSVIMEKFSVGNRDDSRRSVGIQLLGLVLANNLPPISPSSDVDEDAFYRKLASNLCCKYKEVYAPTAEVIGMIMKRMKDQDKLTDGMIHQYTQSELMGLHASKKSVFIICLDKICLHYPLFADKFINKVIFDVPSLHGQPKTQCVDILVTRIDTIENVFIVMKNIGIDDLLTHRDEAQQVAALKLVNGALKVLKAKELHCLLPSIVSFVSNPSAACREVMFDILMWIFDNYRDEAMLLTDEGAKEVLEMARIALLQGLTDEEPALRLVIRNFWSHETRLPADTVDRMVAILQCMYCPITEAQFLSYATNLLLEMTSRSPDYKREIFETPLSECRFEDVVISHSWKQRHVALSTPLFVETQMSQSSTGSQSPPSLQEQAGGNLRATQDAQQFVATQDVGATAGRKNAYNWLTGSQDTFADFSASSSLSSSSMLFTLSEPSKTRRYGRKTYAPVGPGFGQARPRGTDAPDAGGDVSSEKDKEILRLKRRFLKDKSSQGVYFARQQIKRKQRSQHMMKQQHERRLNTVTMYRQYRKGDLPDIQIKNSYVIAPLQALAQHDATLAQMLFTSLFCGIFTQIEEVKQEGQAATVVHDINQHLNSMISCSTKYFPPFIHTIQEIAFHHSKQLNLDPAAVSTASLMSQEINMGIVLLEEYLMKKCWSDENRRKKPRLDRQQLSPEINTWIQLSRLYKAIGEFDALQGIFTSRIGTNELTKQAVEAEARGDYATAYKRYNEALNCDSWDGADPQQVEQDFWDEARLHCCSQLTQWADLEKYAVENVDDNNPPDLSKMWNDPFYQDCYLPYMVKSKLKLLIAGGDDESLLKFIDLSMRDQDNRNYRNYLESMFSEELSLLYILQDDYNRAKYYIDEHIQAFLQDWSGLGQLMTTSRMSKLRTVQRFTEIKEFLEFVTTSKQDDSHTFSLLEKWASRYPDPRQDPINIWDDVTTNRSFFMEKLATRGRVDDFGDSDMLSQDRSLYERIETGNLMMQLKMADSACQLANFPVAKKNLKKSYRILDNHDSLRPMWTFAYVNMYQTEAPSMEPTNRVTTVLSTFNPLEKLSSLPVLQHEKSVGIKYNMMMSRSCEIIAHTLLQSGGAVMQEINANKLQRLKELINVQSDDPRKVADGMFNMAYSHLEKAVNCTSQDATSDAQSVASEAHMAMALYCDKVLRCQEEGGAVMQEINANKLQRLKELINVQSDDPRKVADGMLNMAYSHLKKAVNCTSQDATSDAQSVASEAHMAMALYCDKVLRCQEEDEKLTLQNIEVFPVAIVTNILQAMRHGSTEAMQRFPRLLQLVEDNPDAAKEFIEKSGSVPCWMFISWISQMVALLDKDSGHCVHSILMSIAKDYPQALCYPFKISSDNFQFDKSIDVGVKNAEAVERIRNELMKVPMIESLINALNQLSNPDHLFKSGSVPCWMFISWISQMVALLDKDSGHCVHGILMAIAKDYPQALCYPFKISSDNFQFDKSMDVGVKNAEAVERIRNELMKVPMIESLINALNQLSNPDHLFKDWIKEVKQLFQATVLDKDAILKSYSDMYSALFDYNASQANNGLSGVVFGNFRRKFAQDFQKKVISEFGIGGSRLVKMKRQNVSQSCQKILQEITEKKRIVPANIKEYSTWFLDFQTINPDQELEIPGQYDGKTKPLLSHHVTIAGFGEQVLVLSSLRKPKRIIIRGTDEREYMFLVKGGEDLRLDQRVEQLFTLMNEILDKDATCCQRGLKLKTYQVIPMTPSLGLIEWLQKTSVLRELLYGAMTEGQLKHYRSANGALLKHAAWVNKFGAKKNEKDFGLRYAQMYSKANRTETELCLKDCESQAPPDLLRRAFMSLSSTPEAFLTLKTHFTRTHSVLCICQYLLGIGDRHLSNFLVDMETGGMIGIDFGHAFGSATQFLAIPELVPFRLTRQIMNLLLPFNQDGLLQKTMCHTLRAIRNNHDLLLNTMDVFIKEPSLDWKEFAQKASTQKRDDDEQDGGDMSWYPREKVSYAKAKFKGANPAYITRNELHLGHSTKAVCNSYKAVAKGDQKYNQRAREPDKDLSVETQVACLIDQATDPNTLGRIWQGWEAWM
ncbi:DNA-dependent protein kinase catalytic subunit-like [Anneissia japonica]|uniref:DNA-dependent protein kinase catalytic subunit-like n=1 Tax=Anneissia japonica TaxID=1529436 RepID=UPI0014254CA8|nr:DNA-dependent protein kinase catalytic subunit-like [Anneissia japonica]